ncbi:MAG: hypothetical protein H7124_02760 [Phycisphaerales bacterium]|nr:hypothetical protein [Hyphomonadaceae bacterium]
MTAINRFASAIGAIVVLVDEWWSALRMKLRRRRSARVVADSEAKD